MVETRDLMDLVVFVSLYLLLSLPPYLYFRRSPLADLRDVAARNVVFLAILGTLLLVAISLLYLGRTGVTRYLEILRSPTDLLSVLIEVAFVAGAVSWWFVPELDRAFDLGLSNDVLLFAAVVAHLPVVLFLSLLTAAEFGRQAGT